MKEQDKALEELLSKVEIGNLHEKDFNDNKDDPRSQEKMEAKIKKLNV